MRISWKRFQVRWRRWRRSLSKKMTPESQKVGSQEEKAMRVWKICVKDKETHLAFNSSGVRQVEKNNLFIILQPLGVTNYLMTIMDISESRRSLYEIHLDGDAAIKTCDYFDTEMYKRMEKLQLSKRELINNDLDRLILKEDKGVLIKS